jgi:hypothetical protein
VPVAGTVRVQAAAGRGVGEPQVGTVSARLARLGRYRSALDFFLILANEIRRPSPAQR